VSYGPERLPAAAVGRCQKATRASCGPPSPEFGLTAQRVATTIAAYQRTRVLALNPAGHCQTHSLRPLVRVRWSWRHSLTAFHPAGRNTTLDDPALPQAVTHQSCFLDAGRGVDSLCPFHVLRMCGYRYAPGPPESPVITSAEKCPRPMCPRYGVDNRRGVLSRHAASDRGHAPNRRIACLVGPAAVGKAVDRRTALSGAA